jgi:hypothetical protein
MDVPEYLALLNGDWKIEKLRIFNGTATVDEDVSGLTMRSRLTAGGRSLVTFVEELTASMTFSGVSVISFDTKNRNVMQHWCDSDNDVDTAQSSDVKIMENGWSSSFRKDPNTFTSTYTFKSMFSYEFTLVMTDQLGNNTTLKEFTCRRI